ncbi:MAG TPA: glycosyltransferase family 2 protein [Burkholderiaceae bacterium]|jgi:succinoglycan biosynthesis protein ExoA
MSTEPITDAARSVLVAIPTLNEVHTLAGVVDALRADPPEGVRVSIVVVDGGSDDGTVALVRRLQRRRPELSLLPNPQRLQSAAVNLAALTASPSTDVLIRCDAHASYPPGFVRRLLDTLARTGADAVVVPMDSTGRGRLQRAIAWISDTPVGSGGSAHRGGRRSGFIDHGHHAAFRLDSFRRAGGYDESFSHNEDAEFDCRQRALGGRIYLDADIRIGYHPRDRLRDLWRQYFGYGRGRARTMQRHPGSTRLRQLAVPAHAAWTVSALLAAPWWPLPLAWPALYLAILACVSLRLAIKQKSLCGLLAGPAAAVMHTAWAAGFFWSLARVREPRWTPEQATPWPRDGLRWKG